MQADAEAPASARAEVVLAIAGRALSFAMDRALAARIMGADQPACQLVPPGFPGYAPICAYSANRDGTYAVDPTAAAAEMRKAHPFTGTVAVYTLTNPSWSAVGARVVSTLRGLGYHAQLHALGDWNPYFQAVTVKNSPMDVALYGWATDFPAESQYFDPILSCAASAAQFSDGFCDPTLDAQARAAKAAHAGDPLKSRGLWINLYRTVDAQAPLVPLAVAPQQAFLSGRVRNPESPRRVRRLHLLGRMGSWESVGASTRLSCISVRCGWSRSRGVSTSRSGRR